MSVSSSYQHIPPPHSPSPFDDDPRIHHDSDSDDDMDSLPSTATTSSTTSSDDYYHSEAEREWRESLQQLELLLTMVAVPYLGKYFGRKAAYWSWAKFMEWKYPVTIEITSPGAFKAAGAVEAAASL